MQVRLSQGPHTALGVADLPTPDQVRAAFLDLTKQYHPARFARMSAEVQRMANEVFLGIKAAHESLMRMVGGSVRPRAAGTQTTSALDPATRRSGSQIPGRMINAGTQPGVARTATPMPRTTTPSNNPAPRVTPPLGVPIQRVTPAVVPPAKPTPPTGVAVPRTLTPHRPITPTTQRPSTPVRAATPPRPGENDPGSQRGYQPQVTPPQGNPQPPAPFDERTAYNDALALLNKQQWSSARIALHTLAARVPQSRTYRALLCYSRGREAVAAGRVDDAAQEYQRALQLDPELAQAKQALAEIRRR
jgi:hypothetical protein